MLLTNTICKATQMATENRRNISVKEQELLAFSRSLNIVVKLVCFAV
jgi:hypothetical protein